MSCRICVMALRSKHGLDLSADIRNTNAQLSVRTPALSCCVNVDTSYDSFRRIASHLPTNSIRALPSRHRTAPRVHRDGFLCNRLVAHTGSCAAEAQSGLREMQGQLKNMWMTRLRAAQLGWACSRLESGEARGRCLRGVVGRQLDENTRLTVCPRAVLELNLHIAVPRLRSPSTTVN